VCSVQIFGKSSNIKFRGNPSGGSRVPCGQTFVTKLIVAFRSFANSLKNVANIYEQCRREGWKPVQITGAVSVSYVFVFLGNIIFLSTVHIRLNQTQVTLQPRVSLSDLM
jgi:hypothetical protein